MTTVATKKAKSKLENIPVTIYLDPDDHAWTKKHAEQLSVEERGPVSMTGVIRKALRLYREKTDRK